MTNPEHIAKLKEGVQAWNKWQNENSKISQLDRVVLTGADLTDAYLEHADLRGTHLEHALLGGAHLEHANLMGAHLEHANLMGAHLEHADLGAHLQSARLNGADLRDTNVSQLDYLYPLSLRNLGYRRRIMSGLFKGVRGLDSCYGDRIFARDAADQDYLDTLHTRWNGRWGKFWFWVWGLTDYGRSLISIIVFASVLMFGFGAVFSHWPQLTANAKDMDPNRFTPFYFSIVTYTTLGFGDVRPNSLAGEILVCIEVVFGYITLGLLLAVLGNKIARRS
jgi:hypothetical protein